MHFHRSVDRERFVVFQEKLRSIYPQGKVDSLHGPSGSASVGHRARQDEGAETWVHLQRKLLSRLQPYRRSLQHREAEDQAAETQGAGEVAADEHIVYHQQCF